MQGLQGKASIVTGGCNGIGRAVVEAFCNHGVSVTIVDNSDRGTETEMELGSKGFNVQFSQADIADEQACHSAVGEAVARWGKVNFLVNNAFSFIAKGLDAERDDWHRMMDVGPIGYSTMAQCVAEPMQQQDGGAIVNISSISAHIAQPNRWTYNAAKGAVNQLTRCMAMDLAPWKIRVNSVSPGWIWTREVEKAAGGDREKWEPVWGKYHMLRRLGDVDEVAQAVLFLCSDNASFITAAELPVDGGYLGMGPEGLGETSSFAGTD